MKTKRTPEEMLAVHTENARKAQERLARARDPLIGDAAHIMDDLARFPYTVGHENNCLRLMIDALHAEIAARIGRALSPD